MSRLFSIIGVLIATATLTVACNGGAGLRYQPWEIEAAREAARIVPLKFNTDSGAQTVFYIPPANGAGTVPSTLVLLYPGIGSRALDWLNWLEFNPPRNGVGYILIDYPGRGLCEGRFRPGKIAANSRGAIDTLARQLEVSPSTLEKDLALVGHSFGTGAALQFAVRSEPARIVLISPFTTLRRALFRRIGPLAWILPDGMHNLRRIEEVADRTAFPAILILHGDADESLPVGMGRKLARCGSPAVTYEEQPEAGHVDILYRCRRRILQWAVGIKRWVQPAVLKTPPEKTIRSRLKPGLCAVASQITVDAR